MADGKFKADDGISEVPQPVTPEGGEDKSHEKKKKEDSKGAGDSVKTPGQDANPKRVPTAEDAEVDSEAEMVEEVVEVESSISDIFEGMDLSEDFKDKMTLVFEAAVNEEVAKKTASLSEELQSQLDSQLAESVETRMGEVVENVDKYLDYVVGEWMEENSIAIEAGIKVEMAESLMSGLKDLFSEHNVQIDEESFDAVSSLEAQVSDLEEQGNSLVNENIELQRQISAMNAASVFEGMTEGLSENQKERFKVLSEKLDVQDLEDYSNNLRVIKESFFGEGIPTAPKADTIEEEEIILEEQEVNKPASDYSSINALVEAFNTKKNN